MKDPDETSEGEFRVNQPVGFHNIKDEEHPEATQILRDEYDEDVPNTMEALMPG